MRDGEPLFWKISISDVFEHQRKGLRETIESMSDGHIRNSTREALVAELFEQFRLDAPVLKEDEIYTTKEDAQVDVSQDFHRMISDRSRPAYVPGSTFKLHVPFVGDHQFFTFQPTSFSLNPQVGEIEQDEIVCSHTWIQPGAEEVKSWFDAWLAGIKKNLATLNTNCQAFNASLPDEVQLVIGQRYVRLHQDEEVLAGLGYPTKKPTAQIVETPKATVATKVEKYDAFICHASEDKEGLVKPLAARLKSLGYDVWYDEFELTIGDSLRQSIDRGLAKSNYGVVVLSQSFMGKDWPQYELNGLLAKEIGQRKVILPIWHGISRNEVLAYSPSLADKVALDSNMGVDQLAAKLEIVLAHTP